MEGTETVREVQHFSHQHPLLLKQDVEDILYECCSLCNMGSVPESSIIYECQSCRFFIHKKCAELPKQINHPFHSSHPLSLITHPFQLSSLSCNSCHNKNPSVQFSPWYGCNLCHFFMEKGCAMMDPILYEDDVINLLRHFSHQHPMPLLSEDELRWLEFKSCYGCCLDLECSGLIPTYGCKTCNCFLHKSCAESPLEIQHPFHLGHTLSFYVPREPFGCKLCGRFRNYAFAYKCHHCKLCLCVHCGTNASTSRTRPIVFEFHHHPLLFLETVVQFVTFNRCSGYETYCSNSILSNSVELYLTSSSMLQCLECDFSLHLLCGPLPSAIKHDCHVDPLLLVDSLVEDDEPDTEWYCDVCEEKRNPRVCVYYCKECKFIAHVHCVVSAIAKVLKGDIGDVKLKIVGEEGVYECEIYSNDQLALLEQRKSFMTLNDVINKLTDYEKGILKRRYEWGNEDSSQYDRNTSFYGYIGDEAIERTLKLSHFTVDEFKKFLDSYISNIHNFRTYQLKASDMALKVVEVKGYTIPLKLARVLRELIDKYGDVSNQSMGRDWNNVVYFILCMVVKQMQTTKVVDITLNLLQEWLLHLKFVGVNGRFRIDFACSHFEGLTRAFVGSQAKRLEDEIPKELEEGIAELRKEIKQKEEAISKKIVGLKICKEYQSGALPKSDFMKECERKALELKWKSASHDIFSHPNETYQDLYSIWRSRTI